MRRLFERLGLFKGDSARREKETPDPRVTAGRLGLLAATIGLLKTLVDVFSRK
jgi:hypothetical protein